MPECLPSFARQYVGALACLHARGYVHRDAFWRNVLFQETGGCPRWALADFELLEPSTQREVLKDWYAAARTLGIFEHNGLGGDFERGDLPRPRFALTLELERVLDGWRPGAAAANHSAVDSAQLERVA